MEHYVTLFDSGFLPQGIALHRSLQRHCGSHVLWVLCVDEVARLVLERLALPDVRLLALEQVETEDLRAVRPGRSRAEYCWTLTPFAPRFVFEADPSVDRVTYLDADLWLMADPSGLLAELDSTGKSVLITEHAYAPDYDQSHRTGRYCVQFVTFLREGGEEVRRWWSERCIEWCYARSEPGRFGDQKYLDVWPCKFPALVHVANRIDAILAPWNATRFPASTAVAFHFHGLRLMKRGRVMVTDHYDIPAATFEIIYRPYLQELRKVIELLERSGYSATPQTTRNPWQVKLRATALRARLAWRNYRRPDVVRLG
jgi:hypothetical protein